MLPPPHAPNDPSAPPLSVGVGHASPIADSARVRLCDPSPAGPVVDSVPRDQTVIFVPDKNLAEYVASKTGRGFVSASAEARGAELEPGDILAWDGHCYVHDDLVIEELEQAQRAHPNAKVVIHPEARSDLLERADFVVSTSGMAELAKQYDELIIGTERGLIDKLQLAYPTKTLVPLSRAAVCGNMKVNTLSKLYPSQRVQLYPERSAAQAANTPHLLRFADLDDIYISANSAEEVGSTSKPVLPSCTASTIPPVRPPTVGLPQAAASAKTMPKPSVSPFSSRVGMTKTSHK